MSVDDVKSDGGFEVVDRRRLMLAGLAAATGAGVVASVAEPAVAANGGPVILGAANTATATTQVATSVSGTYALKGVQTATTGSGAGVWGQASKGTGVYGSTNGATYSAVLGRNTSTTGPGGWGVRGVAGAKGVGVRGETSDGGGSGAGVHGVDLSDSVDGIGIRGETTNGYGVYAVASGAGGSGIYGEGTYLAGFFNGSVEVAEDLSVGGTLTKAGGSFRIDHPLDPANKFLSHSFVESPDMKNIYDGVVVLDDDGKGTVEMPDWFDALNRDFRYQLTAIGDAAPNLRVASEMKGGKFTIAGGGKSQKVSWMVTGIRQDAWANAHRIPVEEDKTEKERGKYLHPAVVKGVRNPRSLRPAPKATVPLDVPVR